MNSVENLLDVCLQRLQAGADLAVILADYPEQADDLRPLLETAREALFMAGMICVPASAQSISRSKFLTAAVSPLPSNSHQPVFAWLHWRIAVSTLIVIGIFTLILTATGLASAAALPGDVFYPVKRMVEQIQLNIVQDPPARLELDEKFDDRRVEEVTRLNEIQRREYVSFSGVLEKNSTGRWIVGSLVLDFPVEFNSPSAMADKYVQVTGYSDTRVVSVEEIQLRSFQWDGILQNIEGNQWVVSGIKILLDENSQVSGAEPQIGAHARVNASRTNDNRYLVLSVDISPLPTLPPTRRVEKSPEYAKTNAPVNQAKTPLPTEKREIEKNTQVSPRATKIFTPTRAPTQKDNDDDRESTQKPGSTSTPIPSPTRKATEVKDGNRNSSRTPDPNN